MHYLSVDDVIASPQRDFEPTHVCKDKGQTRQCIRSEAVLLGSTVLFRYSRSQKTDKRCFICTT